MLGSVRCILLLLTLQEKKRGPARCGRSRPRGEGVLVEHPLELELTVHERPRGLEPARHDEEGGDSQRIDSPVGALLLPSGYRAPRDPEGSGELALRHSQAHAGLNYGSGFHHFFTSEAGVSVCPKIGPPVRSHNSTMLEPFHGPDFRRIIARARRPPARSQGRRRGTTNPQTYSPSTGSTSTCPFPPTPHRVT